MIKNSNATLIFSEKPQIISFASVAGKKEAEGPLNNDFDKIIYDSYAAQDTFEKAESVFVKEAVSLAFQKAGLRASDIDFAFSGDLLNQCVASSFALKEFSIPYIGLYGACSTMALALINAAIAVDSGAARAAVAAASSHYCTAERQYRFPLEYGCQRTPASQHTVSAAGCAVIAKRDFLVGKGRNEKEARKESLSSENSVSQTARDSAPDSEKEGDATPYIDSACVGIITDRGITDQNNMGAAMAPAAAGTIERYLLTSGRKLSDFDAVFTGDLGHVGTALLKELMDEKGIDIRNVHDDCGALIFEKSQDVHAGGSGCGCCASVLCGHILNRMKRRKLKNILFVATGALLSPTTVLQKESIPSIAHLVNIRIDESPTDRA